MSEFDMTDSPVGPRDNAARLERILESSDAGMCAVDDDGRFTSINSAGAETLGYQANELIGRSWHELIHLTEGRTPSPEECSTCHAVQSAELRRGLSAMFRRQDGRAILVSFSVVPIDDRGGGGAAISFSEYTDLRRMENEVRHLTEELAEAERRKIEFIAILAHELRNPLAPISNALQIMRNASTDATSMAHLREMMERQLGQMVRLVDDLLDVARIASGRLALHKERVALRGILEAALEASAPQREAANNTLTLDMPAEALILQADATRLTQVFTNILDNAARYTATGGRTSVNVVRDGEKVRIDIADLGVGIAREALNRIFDMFTRVGRETPGTHDGLGIGLNLARRLAEMHDGEVVASSEGRGKGSHFIVTLPLVEPAEGQSNTEERLPPPGDSRSAVRALLVDDNADAADSLSLLLQLGGHTTCIARDGPEALKVVTEFKPDIVLLDIGLPGMTGYDVARAIRRMPELGSPLLVAVTGWGAPEDRLRSKEAGFDEHLTKPVDISMIELILTALVARQSRRPDGKPPVENGHSIDA
jgi:PAS domain S-box-containing protein